MADGPISLEGQVYYDDNTEAFEDTHNVYNSSGQAVDIDLSVWTNGNGLAHLYVYDDAGHGILNVYNMLSDPEVYTFTMQPYSTYTFTVALYKGNQIEYALALGATEVSAP